MTIAKIQHYVPQFILRNFGNGKKDQLWAYDKIKNKCFATNVKNIASESRFYDFQLGEHEVSAEPLLSTIESNAKHVIKKILELDSIAQLQQADRDNLSLFLAIQRTRTRSFREQWSHFPTLLREHLISNGETIESLSEINEYISALSQDEAKTDTIHFMLKSANEFSALIEAKEWVLIATNRKHPFLISDNPLTLQNMVDMSPYGNIGFAVTGIEIYYPLSPERGLAMWCPSITERVRYGAELIRENPALNRSDGNDIVLLAEAINSGKPIAYKKENVDNFNSLQIASSERYVFSSNENFELAKEMISSHPNLKYGPRMRVS